MKVLFLTNVPSPYRVKFFNELGKYCDLTVVFEKKTSTERDESWKQYSFDSFKGIVLEGISVNADTSLCLSVKKFLNSELFDVIVCCNFTSPTGMYAVRYMKKHRIPYIIESDGGFAKSGKGFIEKLKYHSIVGADYYLSTSKVHDEYYLKYGAKTEQIVRYPFSSVSDNEILKMPVCDVEKAKAKKRLGIKENRIVLSVGQFIHRKGFDLLLQSASSFPKNTGVYIVGGEPTEEYTKMKEQLDLSNVHFVGFKKPLELAEYYQAADLFVLPTREDIWGLVINEAMAYGLPVVTTDRCLAGVEMIENDVNGKIVTVDNSLELSKAIIGLLLDSDMMKRIALANLDKSHKYTIETMVKCHLDFLSNMKRVC